MGKKIYKMTESQVSNILAEKKPVVETKKKVKYRITEDQLKTIFSKINEIND
jgi:hypothetical protein